MSKIGGKVRGEPLLDLAIRHGLSPEVIRRAVRLKKLTATRHSGKWYIVEDDFVCWRTNVNESRSRQNLPNWPMGDDA